MTPNNLDGQNRLSAKLSLAADYFTSSRQQPLLSHLSLGPQGKLGSQAGVQPIPLVPHGSVHPTPP